MKLNRLLRTSAVRLSLRYVLIYVGLVAIALVLLFWSVSRFVDTQLAAGLQNTLDALDRAYRDLDMTQFRTLIATQLQATHPANLHVLLIDKQGKRLAGDLGGWPPALKADGRVQNILFDDAQLPEQTEDIDAYWPAVGRKLLDGNRLMVARGLEQADSLIDFAEGTMIAIFGVTFALALGLGVLQGRSLLARIDTLIDTARLIGDGRLHRRIPLTGQDDEFDELAEQLNVMLERIEGLMNGMRQVSDNVAHDLRRPLSRVRNLLDVTSIEARDADEYREAIQRAIDDLDEIIHTFNALIEIAQAEAGSFRGDWGTVDISAIAIELGGLYADMAEEQHRNLAMDVQPGLLVTGNRHLLAQIISNLLDNAFKFTPPGTPLRLDANTDNGRVYLAVMDRGAGIPANRRKQVLKRFVRLDTARSTPGSGLGLSLVDAVAKLHDAVLTLEDAGPGLLVTLAFPPVRES